MKKTVFVVGALAVMAAPALASAQDFGQPLPAPRQSSPKFGTGPVVSPEYGTPPSWEYNPKPVAKTRTDPKVIAAPASSSPLQKVERPVQAPGTK